MTLTDQINSRIADFSRLADTAALLDKFGVGDEFLTIATYDGILVIIKSVTDLNRVRHRLREALGRWEDRFGIAFGSGERAIGDWQGRHAPVVIRLRTKPEEFPTELLQEDQCQFVKEYYSGVALVCDKGA